jgi:hypothetical protein
MLEDMWAELSALWLSRFTVIPQTRLLPQCRIVEIWQTFPETPQVVSLHVFASTNLHLRGYSN